MLGFLFRQFITGIGTGFRMARTAVTRVVTIIWTRIKRLSNVSRGTSRMMGKAVQGISKVGQKPSQRKDFVETKSLYVSKSFIITVLLALVALAAIVYFLVYPFLLSHFFTARMWEGNTRLKDYTGKVIVYYNEEKTEEAYEGYLKNGYLDGHGLEYDRDGNLIYDGEFAEGRYNGEGKTYKLGMLSYDGQFADGLYEGEGELYENGHLSQSGTFSAGQLDGEDCCLYYENGLLAYRGNFSKGIQTGYGTAYYFSGAQSYVGEFVEGLYQGEGKTFDSQGELIYVGGFSKGLYEGVGTLQLENGFTLEGEFSSGVQSGDVTISKNGVVYYEGNAVETVPSGQGALYDRRGNTLYTGPMEGGCIDGSSLLGLTLDEVQKRLGDIHFLTQETEEGFTVTSSELGLAVYFSYAYGSTEAMSYDVCLMHSEGSGILDRLLWTFAEDIDAWREQLWPNSTPVAGVAQPTYAAGVYASGQYNCVIYPDEYGNCTIWSDNGQCFMVQWTISRGQVAAVQGERAATQTEEA